MKASDLVQHIVNEAIHSGNLTVLLQGDAEGNRFEDARGVGIAWLERGDGTIFGTLAEAEEYGYKERDLTKVMIIYP